MRPKSSDTVYYINPKGMRAVNRFCGTLQKLVKETGGSGRPIVFVCIGSDRGTGDSLGPLIGYKLNKSPFASRFIIYGTLEYPVHALNLDETIGHIKSTHPGALVIAIDASLGSPGHLGYVTLGKGSLRPGAGVDKDLAEIGDIFITGIVNVSGSMEQLLLQTTRLSVVMQMADFISSGILAAAKKPLLATAIYDEVWGIQDLHFSE